MAVLSQGHAKLISEPSKTPDKCLSAANVINSLKNANNM